MKVGTLVGFRAEDSHSSYEDERARASVQLRAVDIVQPDQAEALAAGWIDYRQDGDLRRAIFHEAKRVEQEGVGTNGYRVDRIGCTQGADVIVGLERAAKIAVGDETGQHAGGIHHTSCSPGMTSHGDDHVLERAVEFGPSHFVRNVQDLANGHPQAGKSRPACRGPPSSIMRCNRSS